jgi:hypothetical protein
LVHRRHDQNDERGDFIPEGGDGSNRSVVPLMKTKSGPLRLLDIAAEKVDPVLVPVVNPD